MASVPLYDMTKKKVGSVELNDSVFCSEIKPHLINDAVRAQIAWRYEYRTANSLTRTEVHGTGKKIYKQKGTGQARHGDKKAPIFVGGGKAHGPRTRRVRHKINKKVLRAALISVLSLKQNKDQLFVVDKMSLKKPKTKDVAQWLKTFGLEKALLVFDSNKEEGQAFFNSVRNIRGVKLLRPEGLNVFDVLKYGNLVLNKEAVSKVTERLCTK